MNNQQQVFAQLHPLCVQLMNTKEPSKSMLAAYLENLNMIFASNKYSLSKPSDANNNSSSLIDYVLLPVLIHLNNATAFSLAHQELLFNILSTIVSNLPFSKLDLFLQILNKATFVTSSQLKNSSAMYEEYLQAFMNLMRTLFLNFTMIEEFYVLNSLPTIGLLVSMMLDVIAKFDTLSVRLNAIDTLTIICHLKQGKWDSYELGTILATFLPGISIKLIQGFLFQINLSVVNHKLICGTLELLQRLFGIVLNDTHIEVIKKEISQKDLSENVKSLVIDRARNVDWIKNTRKKLKILFEQLISRLVKHDSLHVRLKLNEFCEYFLCETSYSILTSQKYSEDGKTEDLFFVNSFLNLFLVNSMDDASAEVKAESETSVLKLKRRLEEDESLPTLYQLCSNNLEGLLYSQKDTILFRFKLFYSYLHLISKYSSLSEFYLSNTNTIRKLLQLMVSNIKFNYHDLNNLYVKPTAVGHEGGDDSDDDDEAESLFNSDITQLTNYKGLAIFFEDDSVQVIKQIEGIAKLFGMNLTVCRLVCDLLLTDENYTSKHLNEIIFISKSIIEGMGESTEENEKYSIIKYLLDILIKPQEQKPQDSKLKPLTEQNYDIINNCLSLELLGCTSKCLKIEKFKQMFLLEILYSILQQYQNENLLIKVFSYKCLNELSVNLGFKDIRALLSNNYDYIINSLYLGIYNALTQKSYLLVLCSLINICDVDIVSYLQPIVENLFSNLELRLYHDDISSLKLMCYMLVYLSCSIRKWFQARIQSTRSVETVVLKTKAPTYTQVIDEINAEIARHKEAFMNMHKEEGDEEAKEEEAVASELSNEIKIQIKCLETCQHLISYPNKQICLLVVEVIKNFSVNLVNLGHKSDLLPILHKLWQPIAKQFVLETSASSDKISTSGISNQINMKIIRLLFTLIRISDTFLIKRFNEEFLPQLLEFMQKQSKLSLNYKQRGDSTYLYSNNYKLQSIVLKYLPKIYTSSEKLIDEFHTEMILQSLLVPYMDKRQPTKLQTLAVDAMKSLSLINSDLIWLYVHLIINLSNEQTRAKNYNNYYYSNKIKFKYTSLLLENEIKNELLNLYEKL